MGRWGPRDLDLKASPPPPPRVTRRGGVVVPCNTKGVGSPRLGRAATSYLPPPPSNRRGVCSRQRLSAEGGGGVEIPSAIREALGGGPPAGRSPRGGQAWALEGEIRANGGSGERTREMLQPPPGQDGIHASCSHVSENGTIFSKN